MKWEKLLSRPMPFISFYYPARSYSQYMKQKLGIGFDHALFVIKDNLMSSYRYPRELKEFYNKIKQFSLEQNKDRINEGLKHLSELNGLLNNLPNFSELSNEELLNLFEKFSQIYLDYWTYNAYALYLEVDTESGIFKDIDKLRGNSNYVQAENNFLKPFCEELSKRAFGEESDLLLFATPDEIKSFLKGERLDKTLYEKRAEHAMIYTEGEDLQIFSGDPSKEKEFLEKWTFMFEREVPLPMIYTANEGYVNKMQEEIGWGFSNTLFVSRGKFEKSYRGIKDENEFKEFVKKKTQENKEFIITINQKIKKVNDNYEKILEETKSTELNNKTNTELKELYQKIMEAEINLSSVFQLPVYFEKFAKLDVDDAIKEGAELRNDSSALFYDAYRTNYFSLFDEIAKRLDLDKELVMYMISPEIIGSLEKGSSVVSEEILRERVKLNVYFTEDKTSKLLSGEEAKKLLDEEIPEENIENTNELLGKVAYPGLVQGAVRIVKGESELDKIKDGDIVVASMTSVTIVPAIPKIKAIVTDEGGLTCHAAILAREHKIPTIIGTKHATKIFKDNDLVEVDAEKGIVRKIK